MDSIDDLRKALAEPKAFLERLLEADSPAGKKLVLVRLQHKLKPYLEEQHLEWADVLPTIEDTIEAKDMEELRNILERPQGFALRLAMLSRSAGVAKR